MKKKWFVLTILILIMSCKTKSNFVKSDYVLDKLDSEKIVFNNNRNPYNFSTLYIKSKIRYKDRSQIQNVTAEVRVKKGEMILISIRFFGITMAKALLTPESVKYYEKIGSTFFEGDYSSLSHWLGVDLDYTKVENMLLGRAIDDLTKEKYSISISDEFYKLESTIKSNIQKTYFFEPSKFLIIRQIISQEFPNRVLNVFYLNHKEYSEAVLPFDFEIGALYENKNIEIKIEYNSVIFNESLSFPYSVPESYKRVIIE